MTALTEYLLKVILCSGILTGYYWLALRNKIFHQWNRFYLLSAVLLSLTLPLLKLQLWYQPAEQTAASYKVLQTITTNDTWFEKEAQPTVAVSTYFTTERISTYLYLFVSLLILAGFLKALADIFRLYKKYQHWKTEQLVFVDTDAKGTPFSFFNYIFWNRNIAFESTQGQQIFAHEMVHVNEKHSWDKLLLNLLLIVFWINPFFWLIRKELSMIHEFIADKKAVEDQDSSALAAMILAAAFPSHHLSFTNPFFYSPIKRRLLMLSKLQHPKASYIGRLLLLPLLTFLVTAFAVKIKEKDNPNTIPRLEKPLTVVIDAGHGFRNGTRHGAASASGLSEDEFALSLAKKIELLNSDNNLKLVFTRADENFVENKERVRIAEDNRADLFISLHASYAPPLRDNGGTKENPANGFELYVSKDNNPYLAESKKLGSAVIEEVKQFMTVRTPAIKQRKAGIWVVDAAPCPSVLLECGFISNSNDAAFLTNEKNQEKIAEAILKGIANYAAGKTTAPTVQTQNTTAVKDTTPKLTLKSSNTTITSDSIEFQPDSTVKLIIVNDKQIKIDSAKKIFGKNRKLLLTAGSVTVIEKNNQEAIKKYGDDAKNGVIIIEDAVFVTETNESTPPQTINEPIFSKAEIMPEFPGGLDKLSSYLHKIFTDQKISASTDKDINQLEIELIINKNGNITNARILKGVRNVISKAFIDALLNSPAWSPAKQNGRNVAALKKVNISYQSTNVPSEHWFSVRTN